MQELQWVLTEEDLQSLPPREVSNALYLPAVVTGLLEVDLQVVLQVLLLLLVLNVLQQDSSLGRATEGLKESQHEFDHLYLRQSGEEMHTEVIFYFIKLDLVVNHESENT